MRGPKLVGYAPDSIRWAGDSKEFWFEWRQIDDKETSTWVANAATGASRKLTDAERKAAPSAPGRLGRGPSSRGVLPGRGHRARRHGREDASRHHAPRRERRASAIREERDPHQLRARQRVCSSFRSGAKAASSRFTRRVRRSDPPLSDSQKMMREEEQKLLAFVKKTADERKEREAKRDAEALPKLDLAEGESVGDAQLSPDGDHVSRGCSVRATGSKTADVPNYITESSYPEPIPTRNRVGDASGP
jgi:hypothetical protein